MTEAEAIRAVVEQSLKLSDAMRAFMGAIYRAFIAQTVLMVVMGAATALNLWMLLKVIRVLQEVTRTVQELIEERTHDGR